jgi:NAD(P)-dependent dehydrogenase (short-subunit alcohol dehydrogenase family)
MKDLRDRVALVTGGSRGIGAAVAIVLAGAGADVAVNYRERAEAANAVRVWCHPERGSSDLEDGSDYYYPFATYAEALAFSQRTEGAEAPLALIRQLEYIAEDNPGEYRHVKEVRIAEWPVEFLRRPRRTQNTIPDFLAPNAPANRLDILRGLENQK